MSAFGFVILCLPSPGFWTLQKGDFLSGYDNEDVDDDENKGNNDINNYILRFF